MSAPPPAAPVSSAVFDSLRAWRTTVLERILRGSLVFWLIALAAGINNVIVAYRQEAPQHAQPLLLAGAVISMYVAAVSLIVFVTFNRRLPYGWRAGVLLFTFYAIGVAGLALSALSGDGRLLLFAFVALSALLFDWRVSFSALSLSILTLLILGGLEISGFIVIPTVRQLNATDLGAWLSGSIVFVLLSLTVLTSALYLMRRLTQSLTEAQRRASQLTALHQLGLTLSGQHDLTALLQTIVEQAAQLLGTRMGSLYLLLPDGETLELKVAHRLELGYPGSRLQMGKGLTGQVAQSGQPLIVEDYPAWPGRLPDLTDFAFRSILGAPIIWQGQTLGVLNLHDPRPHYFKSEDAELVQLFAHQAAAAIANAHQLTAEREQYQLAEALRQTSIALSAAPDFNTMLEDTLTQMTRVLPYDSAAIITLEQGQARHFVIRGLEQFGPEAVEAVRQYIIRDFPGAPTTRLLAESGQPYIISNAAADPNWVALLPQIRSWLGIPVRADGELIAVISLDKTEPDFYRPAHAARAAAFAGQIALALRNARLFAETQAKASELSRLNAAAHDLNASLELQTVLNNLTRHLAEALNVTSSYISGYTPERETLTVLAEYWSEAAPPAERESDFGAVMSIADYPTVMPASLRGEPTTLYADLPDLSDAERGQFAHYHIQSMLFIPLMARGRFLGNAELWESRRRRDFTVEEIRLAQALAAFAAGAIENARLFEAERRHVSALTALHQIGLDLSAQRELNSLLAAIIDRAMHLLGASMGALYLMLPDEQTLELVMERGTQGTYLGVRLSLGEGASGKAAQTGEPMLIGDYHAWAGRAAAFHSLPMSTIIAAPLKWQGRVIGVINVNDAQPYRYGPAEVELVSLFADQAAMAIQSARLFQKLEEREAYFRALTENAAEGIAVVDSAGVIRYQSPALQRILGYDPDELINQPTALLQLVHAEDLSPAARMMERAQRTPQKATTTEIRVRHMDGNWRWLAVTAQSLLGDERIGGVVLNYRDITERKHTELRRAMLYETLRSVGASLDPEAIVQAAVAVIARFGHWHSVSISLPSADGEKWATRARSSQRPSAVGSIYPIHRGVIGRAYRTGLTQRVPDTAADPDYIGESPSELAVPIKRGAQVLGVINLEGLSPNAFTTEDVSLAESLAEVIALALENGRLYAQAQHELADRTQAQTALASANAELQLAVSRATLLAEAAEKANRLKNEIYANTSHELRTPLVGILGALDIVLNDLCDSRAEEREFLHTALESAQRLLSIVNQLLAAAQLDSQRMDLRLEPITPGPLLQTVCARVRPLAEHKQLAFTLNASPDLPAVWADEDKIELILWHILENAFKFTATGGVTVQATADATQQQLSIAVMDTGIGLSSAKQADLFQSFVQGDGGLTRRYGGLGLGLSTARQIAELMGGGLRFHSAGEDQGATVTLTLRLA